MLTLLCRLPLARHAAPLLVGALVVQRVLELRLARRNEAWARAHGAREYGRAHYPAFFVLHSGWLLATLLEGRGKLRQRVNVPALLLLLAAQPLRYLVIRTLGPYWNTRILIVPGGTRVTKGPFRVLKHPNYAVVALEILAAPLVVGAWRTALVFSVLNSALLLLVRIPAEEEALREYALGSGR